MHARNMQSLSQLPSLAVVTRSRAPLPMALKCLTARPRQRLAEAITHPYAGVSSNTQTTHTERHSRGEVSHLPLAYELVQGPLARYAVSAPGQAPPTAVLVHGILGSKRNLNSFARMIVEAFPSWQVLLVDLRCHGDSAALAQSVTQAQHSVTTAAGDVINLLRSLKLFPNMLIGHSFGGKCVMSMVQQFGGGSALPRPVQLWALDSLPGQVRSGTSDGQDHPAVLLDALQSLRTPVATRREVVDQLLQRGFSFDIANWAATNLRPVSELQGPQRLEGAHPRNALSWSVDLGGISQLYRSYEETCLWPLLERPPQGLLLDFVRAEDSNFRWGDDEARITSLGHGVHLLRKAGHWVHTDNPHGLLEIMAPSFTSQKDWRSKAAQGRHLASHFN